MALGQEFQGLPMKELIGNPLKSACEANLNFAKATAGFIKTIGFDEDGKTIRNAEFAFKRPVVLHDKDGNETIEQQIVNIDVPLLSVVQIPSLKVDLVDVTFDMEIKSSERSHEKEDKEASWKGKVTIGVGWFSSTTHFSGSVSSHKENTRATDKSAKYHVQVKAADQGIPEGLSRVFDLMNQAVAPKNVTKTA